MPEEEVPDLWWSPRLGLMRQDDGVLWVSLNNWESLRHLPGAKNSPMPEDAVRLVPHVEQPLPEPLRAPANCNREQIEQIIQWAEELISRLRQATS